MKKIFLLLMGLLICQVVFSQSAMTENGLITIKSAHSAEETLNRLEQALKKKGIRIFVRISHKENAEGVKLSIRPTELLIFGNPKLGTHFFTSNQTAGIDLPMKAMAWEDEKGQIWLTYNDPAYIAKRHGISDRAEIVGKMQGALEKFSNMATAP